MLALNLEHVTSSLLSLSKGSENFKKITAKIQIIYAGNKQKARFMFFIIQLVIGNKHGIRGISVETFTLLDNRGPNDAL